MSIRIVDPNTDWNAVHEDEGRRFFIGSEPPESYELLPEGVAVVIDCTFGGVEYIDPFVENETYFHFGFRDTWYTDELPSLAQLQHWTQLIHEALETHEGHLFVHCAAGVNRSALVMAMYLKKYHSSTFRTADHLIQSLRAARSPLLQNSCFERMIHTGGYG